MSRTDADTRMRRMMKDLAHPIEIQGKWAQIDARAKRDRQRLRVVQATALAAGVLVLVAFGAWAVDFLTQPDLIVIDDRAVDEVGEDGVRPDTSAVGNPVSLKRGEPLPLPPGAERVVGFDSRGIWVAEEGRFAINEVPSAALFAASADASLVAYAAAGPREPVVLWTGVSASGGGSEVVVEAGEEYQLVGLSVSPRSLHVLVDRVEQPDPSLDGGRHHLYLVERTGQGLETRELADVPDLRAIARYVWSADGQSLYLTEGEYGGADPNRVFRLDVEDGRVEQVEGLAEVLAAGPNGELAGVRHEEGLLTPVLRRAGGEDPLGELAAYRGRFGRLETALFREDGRLTFVEDRGAWGEDDVIWQLRSASSDRARRVARTPSVAALYGSSAASPMLWFSSAHAPGSPSSEVHSISWEGDPAGDEEGEPADSKGVAYPGTVLAISPPPVGVAHPTLDDEEYVGGVDYSFGGLWAGNVETLPERPKSLPPEFWEEPQGSAETEGDQPLWIFANELTADELEAGIERTEQEERVAVVYGATKQFIESRQITGLASYEELEQMPPDLTSEPFVVKKAGRDGEPWWVTSWANTANSGFGEGDLGKQRITYLALAAFTLGRTDLMEGNDPTISGPAPRPLPVGEVVLAVTSLVSDLESITGRVGFVESTTEEGEADSEQNYRLGFVIRLPAPAGGDEEDAKISLQFMSAPPAVSYPGPFQPIFGEGGIRPFGRFATGVGTPGFVQAIVPGASSFQAALLTTKGIEINVHTSALPAFLTVDILTMLAQDLTRSLGGIDEAREPLLPGSEYSFDGLWSGNFDVVPRETERLPAAFFEQPEKVAEPDNGVLWLFADEVSEAEIVTLLGQAGEKRIVVLVNPSAEVQALGMDAARGGGDTAAMPVLVSSQEADGSGLDWRLSWIPEVSKKPADEPTKLSLYELLVNLTTPALDSTASTATSVLSAP